MHLKAIDQTSRQTRLVWLFIIHSNFINKKAKKKFLAWNFNYSNHLRISTFNSYLYGKKNAYTSEDLISLNLKLKLKLTLFSLRYHANFILQILFQNNSKIIFSNSYLTNPISSPKIRDKKNIKKILSVFQKKNTLLNALIIFKRTWSMQFEWQDLDPYACVNSDYSFLKWGGWV